MITFMNEKRWAFIGKILALLVALITVVLGLLQLVDRITTPRVYAIVEFRDDYVSPKIRNMFDERIETKTLLGSIKARREKGELPTKILEAIEDIISESKKDKIFDELDLNLMTSRVVMFCTVKNDSTSLVREAKLVLPGEGQAEISEATIMSPEVKRLNWSGQIVIGDMRPKSTVEVKEGFWGRSFDIYI